jgi:hypothetical protein
MNSRITFCIFALTIGFTNPCCGPSKKGYPVEGAVTFEDGASIKDLVGGVVSFESVTDQSNASGDIDEQGRYRLKTPAGADVPAGRYRVLVMPPEPRDPDHPPPPVLPERYRSYADSGIEVTVEEKANHLPIKLRHK